MAVKKDASEASDLRRSENKFTKNQLVSSARFRNRRDMLEALLDEGKIYTIKEAEEKIEKYRKGKVE